MQRSSPFASAGLRRLEASIEPPLAAAAEHLHRPLQLVLAPDQRVDASLGRTLDQVDAIGGERVVGQATLLVVALWLRVQLVVASPMGAQAAVVADLERPVRDEPQE